MVATCIYKVCALSKGIWPRKLETKYILCAIELVLVVGKVDTFKILHKSFV